MNPQVKGALIGAAATLLAGLLAKVPIEKGFSYWFRKGLNIPDIVGTGGTQWSAEWRYDDGSAPLRDTVTFSNWTKDNLFEGFGEITYPDARFKYSVTGEVSPTRIVVLTYKAEGYPTGANIGTACLQLSGNARDLAGTWIGLEGAKQPDDPEVFKLRGGKVTMHKIKDLKP